MNVETEVRICISAFAGSGGRGISINLEDDRSGIRIATLQLSFEEFGKAVTASYGYGEGTITMSHKCGMYPLPIRPVDVPTGYGQPDDVLQAQLEERANSLYPGWKEDGWELGMGRKDNAARFHSCLRKYVPVKPEEEI